MRRGKIYALHCGRRALVDVVPDSHTGLYRISWPDIGLSDVTNLTRAKAAALEWAEQKVVTEGRKMPVAQRLKSLGIFGGHRRTSRKTFWRHREGLSGKRERTGSLMGGPHNESSPKSRYAKGWRLSLAERWQRRARYVAQDCQSRDRGHPMIGVFQKWQPAYAEHRIATFPVREVGENKKPMVSHYQRIGLRASAQLVSRFGRAAMLGFMTGKRSGITVLDVDSVNDNDLAEALDRHGQTPVIARTARGKFHGLYKYNGEGRTGGKARSGMTSRPFLLSLVADLRAD
jgi:hypothetical protein